MDENKELTEQQKIDAEIEKMRQSVIEDAFDIKNDNLDVSASDYGENEPDKQDDTDDKDDTNNQDNQDDNDDNESFDGRLGENADSNDDDSDDNKDDEKGGEQKKQDNENVETFQIAYGNQNYNLNLEQLKQLAPYAIEYQQFSNRVKPYMPFIDAIEKDAKLGEAVIAAVRAYKGLQAKQTPEVEDKEPEIGDDEAYSDYEKRLAKWRDEKNQRDFDKRLAAYNQQMQQQQQLAAQTELNNKVTQCVMADPDKDAVLQVITAQNFDPALRQAIDTNGQLFMSVYDTIKRNMGLKPLFGAPAWGAGNNAQQPANNTVQKANQPRQKAPFAESGGARQQLGGVSKNDELPDFKRLSDEDFKKFQEKLKSQWIG